jgi:hypothetical protein
MGAGVEEGEGNESLSVVTEFIKLSRSEGDSGTPAFAFVIERCEAFKGREGQLHRGLPIQDIRYV